MNEVKQANQTLANHEKVTAMKVRPYIDIYENQQGASLFADLPGVSKDALDISVEKNVLTLKGEIKLDTPENLKVVHKDVKAAQFERRFTLGDELDSDKIEANFNQGELTVFIPRVEAHQPRKVEVNVL